ncbi:MAG: hypothetical protein KBF45_01340 [Cyclobacteriaceae bacterium]|jgi:ligand-binding sensor domain-containing protein|nr:hypothetical protein [Cyclobacteriaceae bacterium]
MGIIVYLVLCFVILLTPSYAQKGLLKVDVSGAPAGSSQTIAVAGPQGFSKSISTSETFTNLASGTYEFKSEIIIQRQSFISQAFRLDNLVTKIAVKNDTQRVNLKYKLMPGSDKLWLGNQNSVANTSTRIIAFDKDALRSNQKSNATAKLTDKATSPNGMAFDRYGNLWVADAYSIKMFEWNSLSKNGVLPKVVLTLKDPSPCVTFDADGNAWISNGKKIGTISRIPKSKLYTSGTPMADVVLSGNGISGVKNIAFDSQGNVWINHDEKKAVVKVNSNSLQRSSTSIEGDVVIVCESNPPVKTTLSGPKALAFDKQGNLWVGFFGPNVIARIPSSQQNTSATIKPDVQITLTTGVLLHSLAFDENGGLWTSLATGKIGKLSADQLTRGGKIIPEVVITSSDLKYASGLAFYPLPEGLPLR